jgi:hypothetical protein
MARAALFGYAALTFFALASETSAALMEQSVSTSRQFIVYGTDVVMRGVICDLAERTKRELLASLGQRDAWSTAIVINAGYPQANLPELPRLNVNLGQTGFGLKLQLDVVIDPAMTRPEIRRELLRALILEMVYRGEPQLPSGAIYTSPPAWLLDGIPSDESDPSRDRVGALLALSAASGNVWPLHKFLAQPVEMLDAAARSLYHAYSFALVDLLTRGPEGPGRLMQFVLDLRHASNDPMEELRNHFPQTFGTESAETAWQKQIARLSREQPYQLLSGGETERRLNATLRLTISERGQQKRYDLIQFPVFMKQKTATPALIELASNLTALATRAHPVYAPIIAEYAQVVSSIRRGSTLAIPKRLEQLGSTRRAMSAQVRQIEDYLNWFEATSLVKPSGQFADYMKAAERAVEQVRSRRDPISVYLDALETQLEEEKPAIR